MGETRVDLLHLLEDLRDAYHSLPINAGGRLRTWNFIKAFSCDHQMSLLYKENKNFPRLQYEQLTKVFTNIAFVVNRKGRSQRHV